MTNDTQSLTTAIKEIFQTALISFGIFLFVYIFLVQPHRVQGISMLPSFDDGELLLTEKVSYKISEPKKGDVIVFETPVGRKADFIKRIIGLPQDTVTIENNKVIINGILQEENYTIGETEGNKSITLGKDEYFVLGDNRPSSSDSRTFGLVKKDLIRGKVWLVYWPLLKNEVFAGARLISNAHNGIVN